MSVVETMCKICQKCRFSLTRIFPLKNRIKDSIVIRQILGNELFCRNTTTKTEKKFIFTKLQITFCGFKRYITSQISILLD